MPVIGGSVQARGKSQRGGAVVSVARFLPRSVLAAGVALATTALLPAPAAAQFGQQRQQLERVLFLIPVPASAADSAFAVQYAHEVRRRLESRFRNKLTVIPTDQVGDMLVESGYPRHAILGPADAERLARALRADAYLEGDLRRNDVPTVHLHLVDIGRSGLTGWVSVRAAAGTDPRALAELTADSLEPRVSAAEEARECSDRRDRGDFRGARDRAERAFRLFPTHPAAALCAALVMEATNAPVDSQIAMYERAARGDSLNTRAWERLGRLYQQRGDSLQALDAFANQLLARPGDRQLRLGIAAGYMTVGRHERARELLDEWLATNPDDAEFRDLKVRACVEGALWHCALQALADQYERDSTKVGDTTFYGAIIGAAQAAGDTVALLRWSGEAVRHLPEWLPGLRAHASALSQMGLTDSAVAIYERILILEPSDVATRLVVARTLIEGLTIDTAVPLDTAQLLRAGRHLDRATAMSRDTSILMNAAVLYYQPTTRLVRFRMNLPLAIEWLEKALASDVLGRLREQANFFLGFGLMFQIFEFDSRVTASQSCELVAQEEAMVVRGKRALEIGRAVQPQTADQFLQQYRAFEQRIPELRRAFCR
jgi:tetratricopeptide (TPR) repeat protein